MRLFYILILALMGCVTASAQEIEDDYRMYKFDAEQIQDRIVETDTLLFYRSSHLSTDLYDEITAYRFSYVDFARRGMYYTSRSVVLDGIEVRPSNRSLLRRLGLTERSYAGLSHGSLHAGAMAGVDEFTTTDGVPFDAINIGTFFSGKGYLGGVRASVSALIRNGWSATFYASARGGNDLYISGVYNNTVDAGLRLARSFDSGAQFAVVALSTIGERGLRSASTEEAFTLTGDKLYNPSWGYQAGRVRNSRTRRDAVPFVVATYTQPIASSTRMQISFGGDYGHRRYSSLGWYDAMTPRPDNYRYMPSYYADEGVASAVAKEWRAENPDYTQVRWDDMYHQNRMSADGAVYAVDYRVERIARGQMVLDFRTEVGSHLTLHYGLRGESLSSRNYKQMDDLMGSTHLDDVDYYLMDDDTYSAQLRNNLLADNLAIGHGDRFSYDYDLRTRLLMATLAAEYPLGRWLFAADLQVGRAFIQREGYFEKELFPGSASLGCSERLHFNPYLFKASAGYAFSHQHHLRVDAMAANRLPDARNIFLNPLYNNRTVDNPSLERHLAAEVEYKYTGQRVDLIATAYATSVRNQRQTMRLYDDLSRTYCDVDIDRLGVLRYGVEIASEIRFTPYLRTSLTAAAGRYIFAENPIVTHYADTDNQVVSSGSESYMGDCYIGGAPQLSATAELTYIDYNGWSASLGAQIASARYVEPSVVRRTGRVAIQGSSSEEIFHSFMHQQRLRDAVTVDASLSRWFDIGRSRLAFTLSVRNLLGTDDIVYGGYESSRIRNYRSGTQLIYTPQDNMLTYAYPRTYYVVVSWKM